MSRSRPFVMAAKAGSCCRSTTNLCVAEIHGDHSGLHGASLQISNEAFVIGRQQIAREDPKGILNRKASSEKIILHDAPHRVQAIPAADLLALRVGPAVIGNRHFVDAGVHAGDFGRDLRFETKAILLNFDRLNDCRVGTPCSRSPCR